jgi:hypothetical protein
MQWFRSKNPTVLPLDIEIERTIRQRPRDSVEEEEEELNVEEETMAAQNVNQPPPERRPMKQSFILESQPVIMHCLSTGGRRKLLHIPTNTKCVDAFQGHTY